MNEVPWFVLGWILWLIAFIILLAIAIGIVKSLVLLFTKKQDTNQSTSNTLYKSEEDQ